MPDPDQQPAETAFEVQRKVRVKDADGTDAYELIIDDEGVAIRTLKVRFKPSKVPVANLRSALAALDS